MPATRVNYHSFFLTFAQTTPEQQEAYRFQSLMRQQGEVLERLNMEVAMHRGQYEEYCTAMEARNEDLCKQDETILDLRLRARKEARHKCCWMAAAVVSWIGAGIWAVLR